MRCPPRYSRSARESRGWLPRTRCRPSRRFGMIDGVLSTRKEVESMKGPARTTKRSRKESAIIYPDSDGKPMADNTEQWEWMVLIKLWLEWLFADNADVFVAGDLLWYPVEGD